MTGLARGGVAGVGLELAATPATPKQVSSVILGGVVTGSPAEKAGLKTGDVLVAVDGEEVWLFWSCSIVLCWCYSVIILYCCCLTR